MLPRLGNSFIRECSNTYRVHHRSILPESELSTRSRLARDRYILRWTVKMRKTYSPRPANKWDSLRNALFFLGQLAVWFSIFRGGGDCPDFRQPSNSRLNRHSRTLRTNTQARPELLLSEGGVFHLQPFDLTSDQFLTRDSRHFVSSNLALAHRLFPPSQDAPFSAIVLWEESRDDVLQKSGMEVLCNGRYSVSFSADDHIWVSTDLSQEPSRAFLTPESLLCQWPVAGTFSSLDKPCETTVQSLPARAFYGDCECTDNTSVYTQI